MGPTVLHNTVYIVSVFFLWETFQRISLQQNHQLTQRNVHQERFFWLLTSTQQLPSRAMLP